MRLYIANPLFLFVLCVMRKFVLTALTHKERFLFYSLMIKINRPVEGQVGCRFNNLLRFRREEIFRFPYTVFLAHHATERYRLLRPQFF